MDKILAVQVCRLRFESQTPNAMWARKPLNPNVYETETRFLEVNWRDIYSNVLRPHEHVCVHLHTHVPTHKVLTCAYTPHTHSIFHIKDSSTGGSNLFHDLRNNKNYKYVPKMDIQKHMNQLT